jgi:hypothetical protein
VHPLRHGGRVVSRDVDQLLATIDGVLDVDGYDGEYAALDDSMRWAPPWDEPVVRDPETLIELRLLEGWDGHAASTQTASEYWRSLTTTATDAGLRWLAVASQAGLVTTARRQYEASLGGRMEMIADQLNRLLSALPDAPDLAWGILREPDDGPHEPDNDTSVPPYQHRMGVGFGPEMTIGNIDAENEARLLDAYAAEEERQLRDG